MRTYTITHPDHGLLSYQDSRRYGWMIASLPHGCAGAATGQATEGSPLAGDGRTAAFFPLVPLLGIALVLISGLEWTIWIPVLLIYTLVPFLDYCLGEDERNPPEQIVPQLEEDRYYRYLTYATIPIHFISLIGVVWFISVVGIGWFGFLGLVLTTGLVNGMAINVGDELGHKNTVLEKNLAKIILAAPAYAHFNIEHNSGHHVQVATPEDSASARYGESIYRFARREIPGGIRRGWSLEKNRLARESKGPWSLQNNILQSLAVSAVLYGLLTWFFGPLALLFLLLQAPVAWFQLTGWNYVEHYGLLRQKLPEGRYEECQPKHSWNANHVASNILLFHLERHSDHHYHASRRYQSLRHFCRCAAVSIGIRRDVSSRLPTLVMHKIMDPKVLALADGDMNRINAG